MKKRLFGALLGLCMAFALLLALSRSALAADLGSEPELTAEPGPEAWDGSVDTSWYDDDSEMSFTISKPEELAGLAELVNEGNNFDGKTITLGSDLDLGGYEWTPIGIYNSKPFFGSFDGDNHTISGLYINAKSGYEGLFSYTAKGAIKKLGVSGAVSGGERVGGVVGYTTGTVESCHFTGTVSGGTRVGGVVGYTSSGKVRNCYNTGTVTGTTYVSGVVGYSTRGTVENCYNSGRVSGNTYVGGVMGCNEIGTAENCYNSGRVTGLNWVSGVVEYNKNGTVKKCYNTGRVNGISHVSGVVGYNYEGTTENCYNTGVVTGKNLHIGGVMGCNYGTLESCYSIGTVTGTGSDQPSIGGVLGMNNGEVKNCYFYSGGCVNPDLGAIGEKEDNAKGSDAWQKTAEGFAAAAGFTEWEFGSVWEMGKLGNNNVRPVLMDNPETITVPLKNYCNHDSEDECVKGCDCVPACGCRHVHRWDAGWTHDATHHWHECVAPNCPLDGDYFGITDADKAAYAEHNKAYGEIDKDLHRVFCKGKDCGWEIQEKHHWDGGKVTKEPTYEDEGVRTYTCTDCKATKTEAIPRQEPEPEHEHVWAQAWTSDDPTHHWHACTAADCPLEGDYSGSTDENEGAYAAHTPGEWIVDQDATANAAGSKHKECTVCGHIMERETIPQLGSSAQPDTPPAPVTTYEITILSTDNGRLSASRDRAAEGEVITLTATPDRGCQLVANSLTATKVGGGSTWNVPVSGGGVSGDPYTFTMPAGEVRVSAQFAKLGTGAAGNGTGGGSGVTNSGTGSGTGGSGSILYTITVAETAYGRVSSNLVRAESGTGVRLTVTPDKGYALSALRAVDRVGKEVALKDSGGGLWILSMPSSDVTVTAAFAPVAPASPSAAAASNGGRGSCPRDNTCPLSRFVDTDAGLWYHDGAHYCVENGLMSGVSRLYFAPDIATNRAMFATILYRMEGEPAVGDGGFTDVPADKWYAAPIAWAAANGIMEGYGDGRFRPEERITREQMAATLYRYARYKGYDVSARGDLSAYTDSQAVSGWAGDAMRWAIGEGLITGISSRIPFLDPTGSATRAQVATILMRFRTGHN